ncbi:sensor histidine kinase [Ectobacillus sp. JY-23]|uniref:sensor histidine kinase n=1 Tax=Ectobacillus sp. JY-23 TaxID=2933872 RepID=UPI001FF5303C|nr:sensor histidine kinase [Ectobacillus sp. JY-23]UOY93536.1 sensor histidine kinase [Ectobacillus sp. JY-23]
MMSKENVLWTYVHYSTLLCLGISIFATGTYAWQSKQDLYSFLIEGNVASIPVVIFVIAGSAAFGAGMGYAMGHYMKRRLDGLSNALLDIDRGNYRNIDFPLLHEYGEVGELVIALGKRLEEQTVVFQKLSSEKVSGGEEIRQKAIAQERHRLARELHDSVSQQLFAVSMMMSAVNERQFPDKKQLETIEQMIVYAQSEMRALLLHLRPIQLEGKKLAEGIQELLQELSSKQQIKIDWFIEPLELEKGIEDHLFRIVQEAISNTLRHAKAKRMEVRLRKIEQYAILKLLDDGVGFNVNNRKAGSYGLTSMQERVQEIGGVLKIISFPEKGTQIEVKVPIIEKGESI